MTSSPDRHANARDRKRRKEVEGKLMRGNRSVFDIQRSIAKRARAADGVRSRPKRDPRTTQEGEE